MVGLLDIAEATPERVTIRGIEVDVVGINVTIIARLLRRYESLQKALVGEASLTPDLILELGPDVIGAIIAAGTNAEGNAEVEKKAQSLNIGEQFDLIYKIGEMTFGKSMGPFVEKIRALFKDVGAASESDGKVLSMKSRPRSRASLRSATTPEMFGGTPPASSQGSPN